MHELACGNILPSVDIQIKTSHKSDPLPLYEQGSAKRRKKTPKSN